MNRQQKKGDTKFGEVGWVPIKSSLMSYGENLDFLSAIGNNYRVSIKGVS